MWCNQNIVYIFTMLECIEKCWIYTANFKNADEFVQANDQKELNAVISLFIAIGEESKKKVLIKMFQLINPDQKILDKILQNPYYKHLSYLKSV